MKRFSLMACFILVSFLMGCDEEDRVGSMNTLELLNATANGAALRDGDVELSPELKITLSFSASLDRTTFEEALSLRSGMQDVSIDLNFSNAASKVSMELLLDPNNQYTLEIINRPIGSNGQSLAKGLRISFSTGDNELITSLPPCTNAGDCKVGVLIEGSTGPGEFEYYANYPLYETNARWEELKQAIIVVHGASSNPDSYFGYLTNTLETLDISDETVLVAPFFKTETTGDPSDFYWSTFNWREGRLSRNPNKLSSFAALDALISQLADTSHFPKLNKIVVTGQSSGGLFTHLYAAANKVSFNRPDIDLHYQVSESQYFYYPDGQRINENSRQLYTPTSCTGYDLWPFGFQVVPQYLSSISKESFNQRFKNTQITYILGDGNGSDNSLNTRDCAAELLGSSRYQRGENMYRYMELRYVGEHVHTKILVPGVTHNGSAIYQSTEYKNLLLDLFQQ